MSIGIFARNKQRITIYLILLKKNQDKLSLGLSHQESTNLQNKHSQEITEFTT